MFPEVDWSRLIIGTECDDASRIYKNEFIFPGIHWLNSTNRTEDDNACGKYKNEFIFPEVGCSVSI